LTSFHAYLDLKIFSQTWAFLLHLLGSLSLRVSANSLLQPQEFTLHVKERRRKQSRRRRMKRKRKRKGMIVPKRMKVGEPISIHDLCLIMIRRHFK